METYNIIPKISQYDRYTNILHGLITNTYDFSINFISYITDNSMYIYNNSGSFIKGCVRVDK